MSYLSDMDGFSTARSRLWLALGGALGLPVLALAIILGLAIAPADHVGRVLVVFDSAASDTEAFGALARAGMRPLRVIGSVDGWIAEAEQPGSVAYLNQSPAISFVFRDIGLGRAMAGCLGLATGPARPRGVIP